jgi:hypothetical protein
MKKAVKLLKQALLHLCIPAKNNVKERISIERERVRERDERYDWLFSEDKSGMRTIRSQQ